MKWSDKIDDLINLLIFFYFILPAIKRFLKRFKRQPVEASEGTQAGRQAEVKAEGRRILTRIRGVLRQVHLAQAELGTLLQHIEFALEADPDGRFQDEFAEFEQGLEAIQAQFRHLNRDIERAELSDGPVLDDYQDLWDRQGLLRDYYRQLLDVVAESEVQEKVEEWSEDVFEPQLIASQPDPEPVLSENAFALSEPSPRHKPSTFKSRQKVLREAVLLRSVLGQRTSYFP